jgi:hypothetical protein
MNDISEQQKPKWFKDGITKDIHQGCLNCGGTEKVLELDTALYNGFGGWSVTKDDSGYFQEDNDKEYDDCKTAKEIEAEAKLDPDHDWRIMFNMPLRGGTYQRHGDDKWVLIESNQGFA